MKRKIFTLLDDTKVHVEGEEKIIPSKQFSMLLEAKEILTKAKETEEMHKKAVDRECESLKEAAKEAGFQAGLDELSRHIDFLETEIKKVRKDMEGAMVPLALAAIKKIIGKEISTRQDAIVDIISNALKTVSQHKRVTIYVNQTDLETIENNRPRLKSLFEHLESLSVIPREDVAIGGCIIETEAGIINAQLNNQMNALESAFRSFFQNHQISGS